MRQQGIVLVMALLYLFAVTLLITGALHAGWLQINMTQQFIAESRALENAESALLMGENAIRGDETQGDGNSGQGMSYVFQQRSDGVCGVVNYQIQALGSYASAKRRLESILQIPLPDQLHCPGGMQIRRRLVWRQVD